MNDKYDQFNQWVDQWDKAQEEGIFDDGNPTPVPSSQTGNSSFFGYTNDNSTDQVKEFDAAYWDSVYALSKTYSPDDDRQLDDDPHADHLSGELIQEDFEVDAKHMANTMLKSPNPIRPSSIGKDTDVHNPVSMGATYDVTDIEELEKVKIKLHGLIDKLNSLNGHGQSNAKLEQQIAALSKQIDEMSDNLNRCVPNPQGD